MNFKELLTFQHLPIVDPSICKHVPKCYSHDPHQHAKHGL